MEAVYILSNGKYLFYSVAAVQSTLSLDKILINQWRGGYNQIQLQRQELPFTRARCYIISRNYHITCGTTIWDR